MENKQNIKPINKPIGSTFSERSDLLLVEIMEKNNLEGFPIRFALTKATMFFSRAEITENEMVDSIQKEVNVSPRTAQEIAKEIKEKIIPTLWDKMPEEEKNRLLDRKKPSMPSESIQVPESFVVEKNKIEKTEKKIPQSFIREPKTESAKLPPKKLQQKPKSNGPDKYRESLG